MAQPQPPEFYLGRLFDPAQAKTLDQQLLYDPSFLTTHAVVTGMTGSGKTGLCIAILEEAALHAIPAVIVDPKGDLTNLLLHFPDLAGPDFEPWLDPDLPARTGKLLPDLAAETAERWKNGLADWGLGREALLALQQQGRYTIYTPGSAAGVPVNVLASFQAPGLAWEENRELLREKIASTVTALLGLIGMDEIDPLRSREHILLSNILENAWSQQKPLDLTELILQTQSPPFPRLGAFPIDSFFPPRERNDLAMLLNNFLAAPSFQSWQEGQPLDIPALLYTPDGKPRQNIFYLAHLSEGERMFFTTLLFSAVETWMRTQRGTGGLRALVYFDEILGYLPPTHNPPSKQVLLRMLKQARAFGVGMLLATQNPVDLDYKALSNAGTWFIGRLQTDQDKQRLLDGLTSAAVEVDKPALNRMISGLQKRVFLMHSTSAAGPQLFQSRWTLNFLAGPLTRVQIPALNRLAQAGVQPVPGTAVVPTPNPAAPPIPAVISSAPATQPVRVAAVPLPASPGPLAAPGSPPASQAVPSAGYSLTHPALPTGVAEYYLPLELGLSQAAAAANIALSPAVQAQGILYRPALVAQASAHHVAPRYNLDLQRKAAALVAELEGSLVHWEDYTLSALPLANLKSSPLPQARFAGLPAWLGDVRRLAALKRDFLDWVLRTGGLRLRTNQTLKLFSAPDATQAEFFEQCSQAARAGYQAEAGQLTAAYNKKMSLLYPRLTRLQAEEKKQKDEVGDRKVEEFMANANLLFNLSRKRSWSARQTKHRQATQAKDNLEEVQQQLEELRLQVAGLEADHKKVLADAQDRWAEAVNDITEIPLPPQKKNIFLDLFGIAWRPYYLVTISGQSIEVPGFGSH